MRSRTQKLLGSAVCLTLLLASLTPGSAFAKGHLWDILRVYSNAEGNVQFIDMFVSDPTGTGEFFLSQTTISSNSNSYNFSHDLDENFSTFQTWVLIATQDYADLPGAPTPDYIIPPNFFDPAGDEIHYGNIIDMFPIAPGAMPTDGVLMLERDGSTPVNFGINFAGDGATVILPAGVPALRGWGVGLAASLLLLLGASWAQKWLHGRGSRPASPWRRSQFG